MGVRLLRVLLQLDEPYWGVGCLGSVWIRVIGSICLVLAVQIVVHVAHRVVLGCHYRVSGVLERLACILSASDLLF